MTTAIVRNNKESGKFELLIDGNVVAKSKHRDYFEYHIGRRDVPKLNELGITKVVYADEVGVQITPVAGAVDQAFPTIAEEPLFTIDERFEMMDQLIEMTVHGSSKAMLIAGRGGIGKSFAVKQVLDRLNKTDISKVLAEMQPADIDVEDEEPEIEKKVEALATMDQLGDYKIIKGYASASALYRLLYENRKRVIIFDDCDSVLKDDNAINVLKSALDTYEERWVSWNTNAQFGSDLPQCFKFEGQVIFITNLPMDKVDEAVRTRCFKVDVSMSKEQRVQRMETVLADVMPEVDIEYKRDAIGLLKDNLHIAADVSFRSLMNLIKIRIDPAVRDWVKLGKFALLQA
jgi:hypothetical protein